MVQDFYTFFFYPPRSFREGNITCKITQLSWIENTKGRVVSVAGVGVEDLEVGVGFTFMAWPF